MSTKDQTNTSADYAMGYAEGFNDGCIPAKTQPEPLITVESSLRFRLKCEQEKSADLLDEVRELKGKLKQAQPDRALLPIESSDEASTAIDAMLKEYNYPANPKNAARDAYIAGLESRTHEFLIDCPEEKLNVGEEVFTRTQLLAAIAKERAKRVPDGWKLVPIDPTRLQAKAAADAWLGCDSKLYLNKAMAASKAMLAAAPTQEAL